MHGVTFVWRLSMLPLKTTPQVVDAVETTLRSAGYDSSSRNRCTVCKRGARANDVVLDLVLVIIYVDVRNVSDERLVPTFASLSVRWMTTQ